MNFLCNIFYIKGFRNFFFVADTTADLKIPKELKNLIRKKTSKNIDAAIRKKTPNNIGQMNLKRKKTISIPLMIENPVRSPMVPPTRLSWASVLIFLSLSTSSKVAVSK